MEKFERTRACQMPGCIVATHALWKLAQNGKVAGRDEALEALIDHQAVRRCLLILLG